MMSFQTFNKLILVWKINQKILVKCQRFNQMIREFKQLNLELVLVQLILDFQESEEFPEICS